LRQLTLGHVPVPPGPRPGRRVDTRWPRWLYFSFFAAAVGLFPFGGARPAAAGNVADTGSERDADASEELTPSDETADQIGRASCRERV